MTPRSLGLGGKTLSLSAPLSLCQSHMVGAFLQNRVILTSLPMILLSRSDEDMTRTKGKEPLEGLGGPMSRARTKKTKEALQQVLTMLSEFRPKLQVDKIQIVNCTMFQEE